MRDDVGGDDVKTVRCLAQRPPLDLAVFSLLIPLDRGCELVVSGDYILPNSGLELHCYHPSTGPSSTRTWRSQ